MPQVSNGDADRLSNGDADRLPDAPYCSLAAYGREHRALFVGREKDVQRFAERLDLPETRVLMLHGQSGVGKSSFLMAGVIPYLEEECVGYRFLRKRQKEQGFPEPESSVLFVRATNDLPSMLASRLYNYCSKPLMLGTATPTGKRITLDLPSILADCMPGKPQTCGALRSAFEEDPKTLGKLLEALSDQLPFGLVLVIDQGEEVFTLAADPEDASNRALGIRLLAWAANTPGDFKQIISLRTEYYGRIASLFHEIVHDPLSVREYLLKDFSEKQLVEAIERPTLNHEIPYTSEIPINKYRFRYADGFARVIAQETIRVTRSTQDSVLPLVQIICTQIYEHVKKDKRGFDLRLMSSVNGVTAMGKRLIIVAAVDHVLHFRIFDSDGKMVVGTDEKGLEKQAPQIDELRKQLESLWPPHKLTQSEKVQIIAAVTSIVGHTLPGQADLDEHVPAAAIKRAIQAWRRSDISAFKSLCKRLYLRQPDGTITAALTSRARLKTRWHGSVSFDRLIKLAIREDYRLLRITQLSIRGQPEQEYVSLGHDALAPVAAAWHEEIRRRSAVWSAVKKSLLIGLLAVILLSGLTWLAMDAASKELRDNLTSRISEVNHSTADFGAKAFGYQIRRRWTILNSLAAVTSDDTRNNDELVRRNHDELVRHLTEVQQAGHDPSARRNFQTWLADIRKVWSQRQYRADYWVVLDHDGVCQAWSEDDAAQADKEPGKSHASDDYFNGGTGSGQPTSKPYASSVSAGKKNFELVFSVPIYGNRHAPDLIGVLAMMVKPDEFQFLPQDPKGKREVMVIDKNCRILQHSKLSVDRKGTLFSPNSETQDWSERQWFTSRDSIDGSNRALIAGVDRVSLLDGRSLFAKEIADLHWLVVAQESLASLHGPIEILRRSMLYRGAAISLPMIVALIIFTSWLMWTGYRADTGN
jgi:hypothetical protein